MKTVLTKEQTEKLPIQVSKKGKRWIASRNGISMEGKTKEDAKNQLRETEMFIRIAGL